MASNIIGRLILLNKKWFGLLKIFFMAKKVKYKYRSAITGRFVSEKYANKHPKTTIRIKCK
jgi:hypothetical protein